MKQSDSAEVGKEQIHVKGVVMKVESKVKSLDESININQKYVCKTCGIVCTLNEFDQHVKSHDGNKVESKTDSENLQKKKPFKCDICDVNFSYKITLTRHQKRHLIQPHEQEKFVCSICNKELAYE